MKLKNLFGMAAMAALVLSGCSSDEVVENFSPENAIEFGIYIGHDAQSRTAVYTTDDLKKSVEEGGGFGVFANYDGTTTAVLPNFMNNQKVTWNSTMTDPADGKTVGAWEYSPIKYWPNNTNDKVSFWAYAPYSASNTNKNVETPTFAISEGTDFVAVAEPVVSGKQAVNEKVKFEFGHMMSRIGFKVEAVIDELEHTDGDNGNNDESSDATNKPITEGTTIVVTKVTMNGALKTNGTMTWTNNDWVLSTTEAIQTKPYELDATNFADKSSNAYEETKDEDGTAYKYLEGQVATIEKKQLNNTDSYWMVIPQRVGMNIEVEYYVITEDENLATGYSCVKNTVKTSDFNFTFERGKAYDFVLHLGLTSVKFEATVSAWDETAVNDIIVNVPINTEKTESTTTPDDDTTGDNGNGDDDEKPTGGIA